MVLTSLIFLMCYFI